MDRITKLKSLSLPNLSETIRSEEYYLRYDAGRKYRFQIDLKTDRFNSEHKLSKFEYSKFGTINSYTIVKIPKGTKLCYSCVILDSGSWYQSILPHDYKNGIVTFTEKPTNISVFSLGKWSHLLEYETIDDCYLILDQYPKFEYFYMITSEIKKETNIRIDGYLGFSEVHLTNENIDQILGTNPEILAKKPLIVRISEYKN